MQTISGPAFDLCEKMRAKSSIVNLTLKYADQQSSRRLINISSGGAEFIATHRNWEGKFALLCELISKHCILSSHAYLNKGSR